MSNELISVIVPVYKVEPYLRRCVDSILNQTYTNLEVILVDDGSPDCCPAICDEYAEKDKRVHVIHKENGGVSSARNAGMDYVYKEHRELLGEYIAFIDSDDWIHPMYFMELVRCATKEQIGICICNYESVTEYNKYFTNVPNKKYEIITDDPFGNELCERQRRQVWARIFRKSVLENIRFQLGLSWGEDTEFNYFAFNWCKNNCKLIAFTDLKLYMYFQNDSSITQSMTDVEKNKIIRWYLTQVENEDIELSTRANYFVRSCKEVLASRYSGDLGIYKIDNSKICDEFIKKCIDLQKKNHFMNSSKWLTYRLLFACPLVYRLFRIIDDPTMLDWEKAQKKKLKEAEKSEKSEK